MRSQVIRTERFTRLIIAVQNRMLKLQLKFWKSFSYCYYQIQSGRHHVWQ